MIRPDEAQNTFIDQCKDHLLLHLYVQPRASRNEIAGLYNNALKVRIQPPPVDGAANKMCLKFIAKTFNLAPKTLELVSGQSSRTKTVKITPTHPQGLAAIVQKIRAQVAETS